ncbi:hypothetical protein QW131_11475 [Roseibium salinum]|nr:hypothetical protein [Roseibium salinum]
MNRKGGKSALGRERTFYAVLAAASLLVSGLAVAATLLGPALAPSHFSNVTPAAEALTLSHVAQTSGVPVSAAMKAGRQTAQRAGNDTPVQSPPSPAEPELAALAEAEQRQTETKLAAAKAEETERQTEAAKAAEAQQSAKQTLAAKLTRVNQARTLQLARAAEARTQALEKCRGSGHYGRRNPGSPCSTGAKKQAEAAPNTQPMPAVALASLERPAMRSLARAAPEKAGSNRAARARRQARTAPACRTHDSRTRRPEAGRKAGSGCPRLCNARQSGR